MQTNQLLSLDEIRSLETINIEIAKESFAQAEKRLADIIDTKKGIEQKATSLFNTFVTVSLAMSGFGLTALKEPFPTYRSIAVVCAVVLFVGGAYCFLAALKADTYGFLGNAPSAWLRKGVIDGKNEELARSLAYLTHRLQERIELSAAANERKYAAIHCGMKFGVAGSLVFAATLALSVAPIA